MLHLLVSAGTRFPVGGDGLGFPSCCMPDLRLVLILTESMPETGRKGEMFYFYWHELVH